ncbi:MAG: hypothetical protein GY755_15520, partial [Chloroflexi bacterium]|nr:hypothetical protein [Chloroflexota bacterium]
ISPTQPPSNTAPHNPNNNNNLYQMNSYQSNQIGCNNPNNTSNNQSSNTGINSIHNHAQTGSNYDELPLEFIHNIPNPSVNANNNTRGRPIRGGNRGGREGNKNIPNPSVNANNNKNINNNTRGRPIRGGNRNGRGGNKNIPIRRGYRIFICDGY